MSGNPLAVLLIAAVLVFTPCTTRAAQQPKEAVEPPQIFFLEIDGKKISIELDKPFQTQALAGTKNAILRVQPYRVFQYAGLRFHYPREYAFQADLENLGLSIWTLSGTDCTIMIQRFAIAVSPEAMGKQVAEQMRSRYKNAKKKEREITWKLKNTTLKGLRLEVEFAGSLLHQDLYSFRAGTHAVVLMIQDAPNENGEPSADRVRAEKMLQATFRNSSQAAADGTLKQTIIRKVEELNNAVIKGNYAKIVDLTHPNAVKLNGGRDKMIGTLKSGMEDLKSKGFALRSAKIDDPSEPVRVDSELFVVVPFLLEMTVPGGRLLQKGFVIGVSSDKGKTWSFVNGIPDDRNIKKVLPNLPEKLKLPKKQQPILEKD